MMATNLALDDRLIQQAQKLGGHRTKKDAVTAALDEYIRHRQQQKMLALFGKIEYEPGYDYKRLRRSKRK
jgi:Arc/MetJ family transcription regulator